MSWLKRLFNKQNPEPEGYARLDFTRTFPHVFWVSSVGYDNRSPEGFRYKVFSVRHEPDMTVELILLRESVNGAKTKVSHMQAPIDKFSATDAMVRQLGQDTSVTFERFDLRETRTFEEFRAKAIEIGWEAAHNE
jgi:hypothetical protein